MNPPQVYTTPEQVRAALGAGHIPDAAAGLVARYEKARAKRVTCSGYQFVPGEPPAEIQLWDVGENPTDYGVHLWTARSAELVMGQYRARGNRLQIDIEHNARDRAEGEEEPDELPVLGGYADLELRDGAPWLRFDWSAPGVEQIRTRQRLYLSPEYDVDPGTGEILGLARVSLVGNPGTHFARVLASARKEGSINMDPMLLAALEAAANADDPKAALQSLLSSLKKSTEPAPAAPVEAEGAPMAEEDKPALPVAATGSEEKPVMASAPVAVAASAAPAPKPVVGVVAQLETAGAGSAAPDALAKLTRRLDDAERDRLLDQHAAELDPAIRVWASSQPLKTVRSYLDSLPKQTETVRAAATRGKGQGADATGGAGLQGVELAEFERACNIKRVAAAAPKRDELGRLVIHNMAPSEWRRLQAASAAGKAG